MSCWEGRQYITVPTTETGFGREAGVAEIDELVLQLAEVQSHLAFQDDTVAALNEAIAAQQQDILLLKRQLELLKLRQDEQAAQVDSGAAPPVEEKPPHY